MCLSSSFHLSLLYQGVSTKNWGAEVSIHLRFPQGKPLPDTLHARSFSLLTPSVGRPPYTLSGYPPCLMFAHHRPVQTEEELAPQSVPRPSHRRVIEISNYSCGGHCQLFSNAVNWVGSRTSSFCSCLTPAGCVMTLLIDMGEKLLLPSPNNPMQLKYT